MSRFVTARTLAKTLGITERRVNQIAKEKVIFQKGMNGKFDLVQCVYDYYKNKFIPDIEKLDFDKEKTLHEKAKRKITESKLAVIQNKLHKAENVEMVLTNMLVTFRNRILIIPSKIAPQLVKQKDINKIKNILDIELREALKELSEYDPKMFIDGNTESDNGAKDVESIQEDTEISGTTSKSDS